MSFPMVVANLSVVLEGDDEHEIPITTVPRSASWELNGPKIADTCTMEFDARGEEWPFHPDDVRSLGFELYAFARRDPRDKIDQYMTAENLLVAGRCNKGEFEASEDGKWMSVDGRDYTARLSTKPWDPAVKVQVGLRLDIAIQQIVNAATNASVTGKVLTVVVELADVIDAGYRGLGYPHVQAYGAESKGISFPPSHKVWDVITDLCLRCGKRVFVRGLEVVITTPQDQFAYADGVPLLDDGTVDFVRPPTRARRMAYGRNLSRLSVSREWEARIAPQQVVFCWDSSQQKTLTGKWPLRVADDAEAPQATEAHGIWNEADLIEMARSRYHDRARGECVVSAETMDLIDVDGLSLLALRAGDPLTIEYTPIKPDAMRAMTPNEREAQLLRAGFTPEVASVVATRYDALARWSRPYYTRLVSGAWEADPGSIALSFEAINYVRHVTQGRAFVDDGTVTQ